MNYPRDNIPATARLYAAFRFIGFLREIRYYTTRYGITISRRVSFFLPRRKKYY